MQRRVRGLFVLCVLAGAFVSRQASAEDDLVLDLGGEKLAARHVTHGSFTMGSSPGEAGHERDEEPAHQVTITKDYWMGKSPITRGQFAKFVADTRYVSDAEKGGAGGAGWDGKQLTQKKDFTWRTPGFTQTDDHPVVLVTFGDAIAFTGWASRKTGKRVRLPTEAEWEYAARASTSTPHYIAPGDGEVTSIGWFKQNAGNGTRPVEQKKPNPLGIFDMSGNVFEWCRDVYAPYHEGSAVDPEITATVAGEPERRVLRGGSWLRDVKRSRSAARHRGLPGTRNADNGFRVVVTNDEDVAPGLGGGLSPDFAPAAPIGVGSTGPLTPIPPFARNGRIDDTARRDEAKQPSEALSWGVLLASPLAAASAVVAWMLLRRKRPSTTAATARPVVRVPQARPALPAPSPAPPLPARALGPAPSPPARPVGPLDLMPPPPSTPRPLPPPPPPSSKRPLGPSPQSAPPVPLTLPASVVVAPPAATAHPTASAAPPAAEVPPAPISSRVGPPSRPPPPPPPPPQASAELEGPPQPTLETVPERIEPEEDDAPVAAPVVDPFLVPYVDKEETADALSSPPPAPSSAPKVEETKAEEPKPEPEQEAKPEGERKEEEEGPRWGERKDEAKDSDPALPLDPPVDPPSDPEGVQVTEPLHFKPPAPDSEKDEKDEKDDAASDDDRKKED